MNSFEDYSKWAYNFAVYPGRGEGTERALSYAALGLTGEAGEYAEKVKKLIRDGTFNKELMIKELGDVLWYLNASAQELGITLADVAEQNIKKLLDRQNRGVLQGSGDNR